MSEHIDTWPCGHARTPENTQRLNSARVRCRSCNRAIANRYYQKKRAGGPQRKASANQAAQRFERAMLRASFKTEAVALAPEIVRIAEKYGYSPHTVAKIAVARAGK